MKKFLLGLICLSGLLAFALTPTAIRASISSDINYQLEPVADIYGQSGNVSESSLAETIAEIIKAVLALLGIIFIALMVYAGFMWMTSAGSEDRIDKSKKTMVAAIIGTAIILCAYIITNFVISNLQQATNG